EDSDLVGSYRVEGVNPDGKAYQGTAEIRAQGDVFIVHWTLPAQEESYGVGFVSHGMFVVAAGVPTSGGVALANVALYVVERGKPLVGEWSTPTGQGICSETLTKLPPGHPPLLPDDPTPRRVPGRVLGL